jgi:hypothetical protein
MGYICMQVGIRTRAALVQAVTNKAFRLNSVRADQAAAAQPAAQQLAASLVGTAFRHAQDPAFRLPWAVELGNQPAVSQGRGGGEGRARPKGRGAQGRSRIKSWDGE